MADFDPYGVEVEDGERIAATTPDTEVGSHHLDAGTPSEASESEGEVNLGEGLASVPTTPSAIGRETDVGTEAAGDEGSSIVEDEESGERAESEAEPQRARRVERAAPEEAPQPERVAPVARAAPRGRPASSTSRSTSSSSSGGGREPDGRARRKVRAPQLPGDIDMTVPAAGAAHKHFAGPPPSEAVRAAMDEPSPSFFSSKDSSVAARDRAAGEEPIAGGLWPPEVLTLDYTPVTAAVPTAMRVPLRQRKAGRVVRLVIGVTAYNEDGIELRHTLDGIAGNIEPILKRYGIPPEEILVMIVIDGMEKVSETMLAYCRRLGLYDDDLVIDEVEAPGFDDDDDQAIEHEGSIGGAGEEDELPRGRAVTMHLFERSVPLPKNETMRRYHHPLPMLLAIKQSNGGKLSSHMWLFEGICRQLHPQYVALFDVGTASYEDSLARLIGMLESSPNVGGVCGQIIPRSPRWWRPLEGAQVFEYKIAHQLLKSAEALGGFITVLPGAFSAYRWEAIRGVPLEKYFILEATPPGDIDPVTANMFLAEDRILCFEIVAQPEHNWILGYDPGAFAVTDVPQSLNEFIRQRRRWANGAFGAALWAISSTGRLLRARHGILRKLFFLLQACYNSVLMFVNWFQPAAFFLAFLLILTNAVERRTKSRSIDHDTADGIAFACISLYMVLFVVQLVLALAGDIAHLKRSYEVVALIWAVVMAATLVLAATVALDVNDPNEWILITLIAAFGVYFCGALGHMEIFTTFAYAPHYLSLLPSMANMVATYSIANLNSTSWGTKGANTNMLIIMNRRQEAAIAREDARRLGHAIRDLALTTREHLMHGGVAAARADEYIQYASASESEDISRSYAPSSVSEAVVHVGRGRPLEPVPEDDASEMNSSEDHHGRGGERLTTSSSSSAGDSEMRSVDGDRDIDRELLSDDRKRKDKKKKTKGGKKEMGKKKGSGGSGKEADDQEDDDFGRSPAARPDIPRPGRSLSRSRLHERAPTLTVDTKGAQQRSDDVSSTVGASSVDESKEDDREDEDGEEEEDERRGRGQRGGGNNGNNNNTNNRKEAVRGKSGVAVPPRIGGRNRKELLDEMDNIIESVVGSDDEGGDDATESYAEQSPRYGGGHGQRRRRRGGDGRRSKQVSAIDGSEAGDDATSAAPSPRGNRRDSGRPPRAPVRKAAKAAAAPPVLARRTAQPPAIVGSGGERGRRLEARLRDVVDSVYERSEAGFDDDDDAASSIQDNIRNRRYASETSSPSSAYYPPPSPSAAVLRASYDHRKPRGGGGGGGGGGKSAAATSVVFHQPGAAGDGESSAAADETVTDGGPETPTRRRFREELEDYLGAIRRAEEVRAARLRAAEEAERQAKVREFDPERLAVRFNNFRLRMVLLWFLSNVFFIALILFFEALPYFATAIAVAILFTGGIQVLGSWFFQGFRFTRWLFLYFFYPSCYVRDERFDPAKTRCCCRAESFYDPDVEWAEDLRYVRPISSGTGLLHAVKDRKAKEYVQPDADKTLDMQAYVMQDLTGPGQANPNIPTAGKAGKGGRAGTGPGAYGGVTPTNNNNHHRSPRRTGAATAATGATGVTGAAALASGRSDTAYDEETGLADDRTGFDDDGGDGDDDGFTPTAVMSPEAARRHDLLKDLKGTVRGSNRNADTGGIYGGIPPTEFRRKD